MPAQIFFCERAGLNGSRFPDCHQLANVQFQSICDTYVFTVCGFPRGVGNFHELHARDYAALRDYYDLFTKFGQFDLLNADPAICERIAPFLIPVKRPNSRPVYVFHPAFTALLPERD